MKTYTVLRTALLAVLACGLIATAPLAVAREPRPIDKAAHALKERTGGRILSAQRRRIPGQPLFVFRVLSSARTSVG